MNIFWLNRVEDACSYLEFILQSIASRDLFQSIDFRLSICWEYLMWMDHVNWHHILMTLINSNLYLTNEFCLIRRLILEESVVRIISSNLIIITMNPILMVIKTMKTARFVVLKNLKTSKDIKGFCIIIANFWFC